LKRPWFFFSQKKAEISGHLETAWETYLPYVDIFIHSHAMGRQFARPQAVSVQATEWTVSDQTGAETTRESFSSPTK
jgi:hypothetical protein